MKVTVFGAGYVGLVTAACFADVGHDVVCVDIDQGKVDRLTNGDIPIYEPGLPEMVKSGLAAGRLSFTCSAEEAVKHGRVQFIAVGTPPDEDGSADLQYVLGVARTIAEHMDRGCILVDKSTVPVGTADKVKSVVCEVLDASGKDIGFDVASNPEFLKEGAAVADFMKPDRIIVGTENEETKRVFQELYAPFNRNHNKILFMDVRSAELTKYAANAMLATKISFMNEMAGLAEKLQADIESVRLGIGSDARIGYSFIYPGMGYGGSCFPKDVMALGKMADEHSFNAELINAVNNVNNRQKNRLYEKIGAYFDTLRGRTVAIWGLSFKPETDDMREAPSRMLIDALLEAGAKIRAFDPAAMEECRRIYGDRPDFQLVATKEDAVRGAEALAICTEWKAFRAPDFEALKQLLSVPVIFDGRNMYDPGTVRGYGLEYFAIGRL